MERKTFAEVLSEIRYKIRPENSVTAAESFRIKCEDNQQGQRERIIFWKEFLSLESL